MLSVKENNKKMNGAMDIAKLLMAILVIGIHTEPFAFNQWLDRGFGIVTRLCVPFFFVASAYFFWIKEKTFCSFIKRLTLLYVIWSVIYLPFDIKELSGLSIGATLRRFLWDGNKHALWYLCGSIIGFMITYLLLKFLSPRTVLIIGMVFLAIGTFKSTYIVLFEKVLPFKIPDYSGSRNGLFYGFPYIALGMYIAKSKTHGVFEKIKLKFVYWGFILSVIALGVESLVFVILLKASSTILWLSVVPYTYCFFLIVLNTEIQLPREVSLTIRKTSTLLYVSQYLFIHLLCSYCSGIILFLAVFVTTGCFSLLIIRLSKIKGLHFLQYLY